ncbi:MAG TPA: glutaminase [Polyangiales bacterium]|nr:glutaminase [Polyangiales bacterium]
MLNFEAILTEIAAEIRPLLGQGKVASYIPALARVPADQFGIALRTAEGREACAGDAHTRFSMQSISKVFTLSLAMHEVGDRLWERVGREPSGDPFNSLVQLEHEQGIPRNPFINAGAIVVADQLLSKLGDAKSTVRNFVSELCGGEASFDAEVARSEAETGFRNIALANLIKSFGKLDNAVDAVLDLYFHQCSLAMSCVEVARACNYLCRDGLSPLRDQRVLTERQARRVNALMLTCGTYDAAGEFAFRIGLPSKSGVGGGIIAILPDRLSLCVWSPGLGPSGNSLVGMRALELFVEKTRLSVF